MRSAPWLVPVVVGALAAAALSCGSGGGTGEPTPTTSSYFGTQSPGDPWTWTITRAPDGSGSFTARNGATALTYGGTVAALGSGFLALTVTSTTDAAVSTGTVTYGVEFPGTALVVTPAGDNDAPVVAAVQGTCPGAATYNWIKMPASGWAEASGSAFGTAVTTGTAESPSFAVVPYLLDGTAQAAVSFTGTCADGLITTTVPGMTFGAAPSGVLVGDQGTDGGVFGMWQPASALGTSAILQAGRELRGFVYMVHPPEGQTGTVPIWARTAGDDLIHAGGYTDFPSGVEDTCPSGPSCATMSLGTESPAGLFLGQLADNHPGSPVNVVLAVNRIDGKYMVFGFSMEQAGSGVDRYPYLILAMEQ